MIEAERFVWATIVQLFSFVGVNMVHHPGDVFLIQVIEACPFGKHSANQAVIDFNSAFLVGATGIAVVYPCAQIAILIRPIFDSLGIG